MKQVIACLLAGLLAYTAWLQINDPDPLYWVSVYLAAAAIPLQSFVGKRYSFFNAVTLGMILSGMLWAVPGFIDWLLSGDFGSITGSMDGPHAYVEPAREFIGLLMALLIAGYYMSIRR